MLQVTDPTLPFQEQVAALKEVYLELTGGRDVLLRRFFLSDAANQLPALGAAFGNLPACATSVVQQPPLGGCKVAAWVWCAAGFTVEGPMASHNGYSHHWIGGLHAPDAGPEGQVGTIFRAYESALAAQGMSVAGECIRTWIFVRDVDTNYAGVVKGRRDYFSRIGLTPRTRFIASTGIQGSYADPAVRVGMDAYAVGGLAPGQIRYLHAYDHLSPTAAYGVTFERGTAVSYGDRRHVFISGTASIDAAGQVLYPGDPVRQSERLVENVSALLAEAEAGLEDVRMALVYLRDTADYVRVRAWFETQHPELEPIYLLAPVCRPAWLVEMECIAVLPVSGNPFPAL
ncbi:MAG: hypothetical protein IJ654_07690 [Bacteroidales bacterium]|nr:hypothetical protein [Bacteroidales bacterium]